MQMPCNYHSGRPDVGEMHPVVLSALLQVGDQCSKGGGSLPEIMSHGNGTSKGGVCNGAPDSSLLRRCYMLGEGCWEIGHPSTWHPAASTLYPIGKPFSLSA